MPQVELVKEPERYFQLLASQSTQVKHIQFVKDECVEVYYTRGDDVIAAFTTAHARLKLYSVLECLQTRVLYFDRVRNCDQLVANATENLALATRISRPVASRRLTFSIGSLF